MKILGGLLFGIILGYIFQVQIDEKISAVIIMAAADAICGGIAAKMHLNFNDTILIGGFLTNLIFGFILILLGKILGVELYYIALLIFGLRIFKNISAVKESFLKSFEKN